MNTTTSHAELGQLQARIAELEVLLRVQDEMYQKQIEEQAHMLEKRDEQIETLSEQVRLLKALEYARRSEKQRKLPSNELQLSLLFNEAEHGTPAEQESSEGQEPSEAEVIEVPAHTRAKRGRKPLPENLPRVEIIHDIPEEDKICACGCQRKRIGEVASEKLSIIPQQIKVERHIRPKYACPKCEGTAEDDKPTVKIAPMPPQFIKQGIVTPGLLAYILMNKFCDALPFYRQTRIFERFGVEISDSTMSSWTIQAAERCEPLINLYLAKLRAGEIINMDETTVQVLRESDRENTTKSYMWVARGGLPNKPVLLYHYEPSRASRVAQELLGDFKGFLQTDGYGGYNALGRSEGITHVGCLAHVRRKFMDVTKATTKKKAGVASTVIDLIGKIYHVEKVAKDKKFTPEEILKMREERVKPLFAKIKDILDTASAPPSSTLGKAVTYALGQWSRVEAYLQNPRLSPDNNIVENAIRPFAVGRKNWLFSGSPRGAKSSAALYSMIETAKANDVDPYQYLLYVFEGVTLAKTEADWEKLFPWNMPKE
ncbi:MAG: IS66 family transposase [Pseudomonadota bacterium]